MYDITGVRSILKYKININIYKITTCLSNLKYTNIHNLLDPLPTNENILKIIIM